MSDKVCSVSLVLALPAELFLATAHLMLQFLTTPPTDTAHLPWPLSPFFLPHARLFPCPLPQLAPFGFYRRPSLLSSSNGPQLFTLATDEQFAGEEEVIRESLEKVERGMSEFFDSALRGSSPRGGDWVLRGGD